MKNYFFRHQTLQDKYEYYCSHLTDEEGSTGDTNQHLPTLFNYAKRIDHVTEFGVRHGVSTTAFLAAKPKKIVAYDIVFYPEVQELVDLSIKENIDFSYILKPSQLADIEDTDLLFIDTHHTGEQLELELNNTAVKKRVRKYLIFHDTISYGQVGEGGKEGILFAIKRFLEKNSDWQLIEHFTYNYGLLILGNKGNL